MNIRTARRYAFFAVLIMVLAGATGSFLRFALAYGMPPGWGQIRHVVHAHSHTMFGWTILALMALIWSEIPRLTGKPLPRGVTWQMGATFIFSLLQLPAFWPNGYGITQIGPARMPLGAMSAGFAGLTWFWFMGLYGRAVRGGRSSLPLRLWHGAVVLLFIASLGAMAEPVLMILKVENEFVKHLFLHLFLDLFTTGWLLLAIFGALWAYLQNQGITPQGWLPVASLALVALPTFLLGMPPSMLSPAMYWVAVIANLALAVLAAFHLRQFWINRRQLPLLVQFGLAGLVIQMGAAVLMLVPSVWQWGVGTLRIFYLHNMLLLWTSSALLGLLLARWGHAPSRWTRWVQGLWMVGVGWMWLALLLGGFTVWLPVSGRVFLEWAAWASVIIVLAAIMVLRDLKQTT